MELIKINVPLGLEPHRLAQQFCRRQVDGKKAKQVYLNTLAVWAVHFYLKCMEIETNLEDSDSFNLGMQTIANIADLDIVNIGKLECRPVLPEEKMVYIPPEVQENRIAYVAVQMSESLRECEILGFATAVSGETLALGELQSIEELLPSLNFERSPVDLSRWFQDIFEEGWKALHELLPPEEPQLGFNFRGESRQRAQLINLGIEQDVKKVILVVTVAQDSPNEVDVLVEVQAPPEQTYLPDNLQVKLLNEAGEAVLEATAMGENKNIQLEFSGEPEDRFSVRIILGDVVVTENFKI
jgi:hypothetical protein